MHHKETTHQEINDLIHEIKEVECIECEKKALHVLYDFLFSAIKNHKWDAIEKLIINENTQKLKIVYLIGIYSIIHEHRSNINPNFYETTFFLMKVRAQKDLSKNDFDLTFEEFKED